MDEDLWTLYTGSKIRIQKINQTYSGVSLQSEADYRIDGGSDVAAVSTTGKTERLSNTYSKSVETVQNMSVFVVYVETNSATTLTSGDPTTGGKKAVFMTEEFNDTQQVDASTWTIYYSMLYSIVFDTEYFNFGSSTRNSNITNFSWSNPSAKAWQTAIMFVSYLSARSWQTSLSFLSYLSARQWTTPLSFNGYLATRQWQQSLTFLSYLSSRAWQNPLWFNSYLDVKGWRLPITFLAYLESGEDSYLLIAVFSLILTLSFIFYLLLHKK
jgi:hypothetical protein